MRDDHRLALKKDKQQILSFCLRHGFQYTETNSRWTQAHINWLRKLELEGLYQETMAEYLMTFDRLTEVIERLDKRIAGLAEQDTYRSNVKKLTCFMDLRMPVMDGFTAAEEIRKLDRADASSVQILAMSADAYEEDIEKCRRTGMNGHISKPIDNVKMFDALEKACFNEKQFRIPQIRLRTSSGTYIWVEMDVTLRENLPNGKLFYASYRDISKEVQLRQELDSQRQKNVEKTLLDTIGRLPTCSILYRENKDGPIVPERFSKEYLCFRGYAENETPDAKENGFLQTVHPDDRDCVIRELAASHGEGTAGLLGCSPVAPGDIVLKPALLQK